MRINFSVGKNIKYNLSLELPLQLIKVIPLSVSKMVRRIKYFKFIIFMKLKKRNCALICAELGYF